MESAFSYIAGLVEAFEDVGKGNRNKKDKSNPSPWTQGAIPSCNLNIANSTDDYCGAFDDLEQNVKRRSSFEDEGDDDYNDTIQPSASYRQQHAAIESVPSISEKKSFSDKIKSKRSDLANKFSLLQSFSAGSSTRNPPDVTKSRSSMSNTTQDASTDVEENDQTDFGLAQSYSLDSRDDFENLRRRTPPSSNPHLHWFAHGLLWTCMAIAFGWMGVGFSYAARQSTSFVQTKDPMYLDPRYETIPGVGMIQMELCFNQTHLDILEELNDNGFQLEREHIELGAQARTRTIDSTLAQDDDNDEIGPSIVDLATTPCIIHKLTSDDVHDDPLYTLARCMAFLSMVLGGFLTTCLTFSIFWKTINLRPIGAGLLVAYFMQSFTFLIFDSNLCKENMGCTMGVGGNYSAVASVCWIVACAACARMEKRKIKNEEREEAALRRELRKRRKSEHIEHQVYPHHIMVEKEIQPKSTKGKSASEKMPRVESNGSKKPKAISKNDRASTADTTNMYSDEDSQISKDSDKILQDLNESNADPVYIPSLPETSKNEKKKETNSNPKSKKSQPKKKPKTKKSSDFKDEELETKINTKRKSKGSKPSQAEERSRSPAKSIDMAGDVVDEYLGDRVKSSTRVNEQKSDEPDSHGPRRSKCSSRPRKTDARTSLRQSIEEGKHYEL